MNPLLRVFLYPNKLNRVRILECRKAALGSITRQDSMDAGGRAPKAGALGDAGAIAENALRAEAISWRVLDLDMSAQTMNGISEVDDGN